MKELPNTLQELLDVAKEEEELNARQLILEGRVTRIKAMLELFLGINRDEEAAKTLDHNRYDLLEAIYAEVKDDSAKRQLLASSELSSQIAVIGKQLRYWPEGSDEVSEWVAGLFPTNTLCKENQILWHANRKYLS